MTYTADSFGIFGPNYVRVFDESGNLLFSKDSVDAYNFVGFPGVFGPQNGLIFNTDEGAKMILTADVPDTSVPVYVYSLPGMLECNVCGGQPAVNLGIEGNSNTDFKVFPNPSNGFSLVQYELPADAEHANLLLFDVSGRELRRFAVDKSSTRLMLPTAEFAQGTYFYALDIPGKGLTTKKVLIIH